VATEVRSLGGEALSVPLDVSDPSAVGRSVLHAARNLGSLDLVIANAGCGAIQDSAHLTFDDVAAILDVNIRGAVATLLAAIPLMCARGRGHLVGVSSLAGARGMPRSAAYCASKAALSRFLESLRVDLAPLGIHVTDVQPGFMDTPMLARATHRTPWRWPADRAARHVIRALDRSPAVIAFPWPLVVATRLARLLPAPLYDRAMRASGPRASPNDLPVGSSGSSNTGGYPL
jgi:NAD(P)-dependent dehydrogenase (short-subunit alcohol dehydrogenase family)